MIEQLKAQFKKKNNVLNQLIILNVVFFAVLTILLVFAKITSMEGLYLWVENQLLLSSSWDVAILKPWTLITYFFNHKIPDVFHILFNMLGLYWFGLVIEDLIGSKRLLSLYIYGGLIAGLAFVLIGSFVAPLVPHLTIAGKLVGASGAVYAVVVGAATLTPEYHFHLLLFGRVKIVWIALFFMFTSFIGLVGDNAGGNIAHLIGGLTGYFYISSLKAGNDWGKAFYGIFDIFKNKKGPKVAYRKSDDIPDEDEVDALLDKINKKGYESLTKEEKQRLFKASNKKK